MFERLQRRQVNGIELVPIICTFKCTFTLPGSTFEFTGIFHKILNKNPEANERQ